MDILYRRGRATAGEVMDELPGDPSYSTVRTQLRVLEEKGHVRHEEQGLRYVYVPAVPAARRAEVGAAAPGGHLLRRLRREDRRGAARRRERAAVGRGAGPHCRADCESEKGRIAMSLLLESTLKVSLIVLFALACDRARCASGRRRCGTGCCRPRSPVRRSRRCSSRSRHHGPCSSTLPIGPSTPGAGRRGRRSQRSTPDGRPTPRATRSGRGSELQPDRLRIAPRGIRL